MQPALTACAASQMAMFFVATICMHLGSAELVHKALLGSQGLLHAPAAALRPLIMACLRGVLAAMVDGRIGGHTCMAAASFQAAAATVHSCVPALAAGTTRILGASDPVRALWTPHIDTYELACGRMADQRGQLGVGKIAAHQLPMGALCRHMRKRAHMIVYFLACRRMADQRDQLCAIVLADQQLLMGGSLSGTASAAWAVQAPGRFWPCW